MVLEKVTFNPRRSVLYVPDASKQMAQLTIENNSDQIVTFKMKSTRPGLFKMRPVFGTIAAGEKVVVKLIFKGLKAGMKANMKERYTCVYTVAQGSTAKTAKIWKQHKHRQKLADSEMRKQKIMILYKGINDTLPLKEDGSEDAEEKKATVIRRGPGAADAEKEQAPCSTRTAAEKAMPVVVMFRERPPPSDESKSDDSDDEDKPEGEKSQYNSCVTAPMAPNINAKPVQVELPGARTKKTDFDDCMTAPLNDQIKGAPVQLPLNPAKNQATNTEPKSKNIPAKNVSSNVSNANSVASKVSNINKSKISTPPGPAAAGGGQ